MLQRQLLDIADTFLDANAHLPCSVIHKYVLDVRTGARKITALLSESLQTKLSNPYRVQKVH
jgi:hypothetical protein